MFRSFTSDWLGQMFEGNFANTCAASVGIQEIINFKFMEYIIYTLCQEKSVFVPKDNLLSVCLNGLFNIAADILKDKIIFCPHF
jgi:hypothetical protein